MNRMDAIAFRKLFLVDKERRGACISRFLPLLALFVTAAWQQSFARSFPDSKLPAYIKPVTDSGERPDWSLDGKRLLFLNHSGGDVFEVEVATKKVRLICKAPAGTGCWRALYLANGDYFFTAGAGRNTAYAYILDSARARPPVRINTIIHEGPAISRTRMKICYTNDDATIWMADILYTAGTPRFANGKMIIDNSKVTINGAKVNVGAIEPQNFRLPAETELTFDAYGNGAGEGFLYDLVSGAYTNFTQDAKCYEEVEGMFPGGLYSLVESNRHVCQGGSTTIDIYRYSLSDPQKWVRLTNFYDVPPLKASNPVVSDDGKYFAFMEGRTDVPAGVGYGIYVYDLVAAGYFEGTVGLRSAASDAAYFPSHYPKRSHIGYDLAGRSKLAGWFRK